MIGHVVVEEDDKKQTYIKVHEVLEQSTLKMKDFGEDLEKMR